MLVTRKGEASMVPDRVHFVGSIALDSVEEVFRTLGAALGNRLQRVPDGEPGGAEALDQLAISVAAGAAIPQSRCQLAESNHGFSTVVAR